MGRQDPTRTTLVSGAMARGSQTSREDEEGLSSAVQLFRRRLRRLLQVMQGRFGSAEGA